MRTRTTLIAGSLLAVLSVGLLLWLRAQPTACDPEQNIRWLASGTSPKQVDKAYPALIVAGSEAVPALIAHLDDKTPADVRFERQVVVIAPDGTLHPHRPTIGDVCFDILQTLIEGKWPKGMAYYRVVNSEWLRTHASKDLRGMREIALHEAQLRAKAKNDLEAVQFLQKQLGHAPR